jgi:hypothetical protein
MFMMYVAVRKASSQNFNGDQVDALLGYIPCPYRVVFIDGRYNHVYNMYS